MTPDQLRGEVPRVFRPLPTSHSQEDWPQSSHYAPSRPGWAAWDPGENWVGCPLPQPPQHKGEVFTVKTKETMSQ